MRSVTALIIGTLVLGGVANAQTNAPAAPGGAAPSNGYIEGVAQSAFGRVTSQSFGAEMGARVVDGLQVFVEGGLIRDVSAPAIGAAAQLIAGFLSRTQSGAVAYRVKQPVTFGAAGVKLLFPVHSKLEPYVMVGGGVARVKQDVTFTVGGTDVTGNMAQYGVVLGSDLSGTFTKVMVTFGVGVMWPMWQQLVVDFQYRYGRIFAEDQGINVGRVGAGVGVRF